MTAPINIAATPVYRRTPPEQWQEAASAYRRWWSRHPGLSSALNLLVRGAYALMIPLLIAALVMVPSRATVRKYFSVFTSIADTNLFDRISRWSRHVRGR